MIIVWLFVPMRRLSQQHPRNLDHRLAASHNTLRPHFHLQIPAPNQLCSNTIETLVNVLKYFRMHFTLQNVWMTVNIQNLVIILNVCPSV